MKIKFRLLLVGLLLILTLSGCSDSKDATSAPASPSDLNAAANLLYVKAVQAMQNAKVGHGTYDSLLNQYYEVAKSNLNEIITKYPSTQIAVDLVSGRVNTCDLSLKQFAEMEGTLRALASAELDPIQCAYFISISGYGNNRDIEILLAIYNQLMMRGERDVAGKYMSLALEVFKKIPDSDNNIINYNRINVKYLIAAQLAKSGETDRALALINKKLFNETHFIWFSTKSLAELSTVKNQPIYSIQVYGRFLESIQGFKNEGNSFIEAEMMLASKFASLGERSKADYLLAENEQNIRADKKLLVHAGVIYAKNGESDKAESCFKAGMPTSRDNIDDWITIMSKIAGGYELIGNRKVSDRLNNSIYEFILKQPRGNYDNDFFTHIQVDRFSNAAGAYAEMGLNQKACDALDQAVLFASAANCSLTTYSSLLGVANLYIRIEQYSKAIHSLVAQLGVFKPISAQESFELLAEKLTGNSKQTAALAYVKSGSIDKALLMAAPDGAQPDVQIMAEIALKLVSIDGANNLNQLTLQQHIVQLIYPRDKFWLGYTNN
ncbi:MAG: hypothetical protein WC661_12620 [Opitutaceae bacterium]|jgi:tetratricopeptide (TPR) repeat protein